jgi:hypothetical protein
LAKVRVMPQKSRNIRNVHEWKTQTEEGEKREVRAEKHGGKWRLQARLKDEEDWTYYKEPLIEDLVELRLLLWRKYQRKRLAWDDIISIERLIKERGVALEPLK